MQSLEYGFGHLHGHDPPQPGMLCARLKCLVTETVVVAIGWKRHCGVIVFSWLRVSEEFFDDVDAGHEELIEGIVGAERLHAEHLPADLAVKLETHSHLATLGQRTVLAQQDHVEHLLATVVGHSESHLLPTHLRPVTKHEIFNYHALMLIRRVEVTEGLIVSRGQLEVQIHKSEHILRRSTHYIRGHLF